MGHLDSRLPPGSTVGRWLICGYLGYGQSGESYHVRDHGELRRHGVMKIMRGTHVAVSREEFLEETEIVSRNNIPGAMAVFLDAGVADEMPYIVTEHLDPLPVVFPPKSFVPFALELIDTVVTLIRNNIFHCDIKPNNIALKTGHVRLIDFGCACTASTAANRRLRVGSKRYRAPELDRGEHVSARSEMYSVAVTLEDLCPDEYRDIFAPIFSWAKSNEPCDRPETFDIFRDAISNAIPSFKDRAAAETRLPRFKFIFGRALLTVGAVFVSAIILALVSHVIQIGLLTSKEFAAGNEEAKFVVKPTNHDRGTCKTPGGPTSVSAADATERVPPMPTWRFSNCLDIQKITASIQSNTNLSQIIGSRR